MNHYPLIGRRVPGSCNDATGTADPFAHIDCPHCRARLAWKVKADSDSAAAITGKRDAQLRDLLMATSRNYAAVLAA